MPPKASTHTLSHGLNPTGHALMTYLNERIVDGHHPYRVEKVWVAKADSKLAEVCVQTKAQPTAEAKLWESKVMVSSSGLPCLFALDFPVDIYAGVCDPSFHKYPSFLSAIPDLVAARVKNAAEARRLVPIYEAYMWKARARYVGLRGQNSKSLELI